MGAESGATELAIRQKDTYFVRSKIVVATPPSQCENIGHVSPEAAAGGVIGLVEECDITEICVRYVAFFWL